MASWDYTPRQTDVRTDILLLCMINLSLIGKLREKIHLIVYFTIKNISEGGLMGPSSHSKKKIGFCLVNQFLKNDAK